MNHDVFPLLDVPEIVSCLRSCDLVIESEQDILKPTPAYVISLYEQIIGGFTSVSLDAYVDETTKLLAEDDGGGIAGSEGYGYTLRIIALNRACYNFFRDIGVPDFGMLDLKRPDPERTRRLLSAVVNFARFREERMFDCDGILSKIDSLVKELDAKFDVFNEWQQRTDVLQKEIVTHYRLNSAMESNISKQSADEDAAHNGDPEKEIDLDEVYGNLESDNLKLESQLKRLTNIQETLSIDYSDYKFQKQGLLKELETLSHQLIELEAKRQKLDKSFETDISVVDAEIAGLTKSVEDKQKELDKLISKQENLKVSTMTYETLINDLYDLLNLFSGKLFESTRNEQALLEAQQQLKLNKADTEKLLTSTFAYKVEILREEIQKLQPELQSLLEKSKNQLANFTTKQQELIDTYNNVIVPQIREKEDYISHTLLDVQMKEIEDNIKELRSTREREKRELDNELTLFTDSIARYMESILEDARIF